MTFSRGVVNASGEGGVGCEFSCRELRNARAFSAVMAAAMALGFIQVHVLGGLFGWFVGWSLHQKLGAMVMVRVRSGWLRIILAVIWFVVVLILSVLLGVILKRSFS